MGSICAKSVENFLIQKTPSGYYNIYTNLTNNNLFIFTILEISILQKRLELRSARLKNELAKEKCTGCSKKDGLISTLFEKVNLYESAIMGKDSEDSISSWDLETIIRSVFERLKKFRAKFKNNKMF